MDLRRLARALPTTVNSSGNLTDQMSFAELSPNILESLVPGYGPVARYVALAYGIDISMFVSATLIGLAVVKGSQYLFSMLLTAFRKTLTSSIYIDEQDDLYDMVMGWMAMRQNLAVRRALRAKTQRGATTETLRGESDSDVLDEDGMFSYHKWNARSLPRFEPYYGRHMVWHKGSLIIFHCSQRAQGGRVQIQFGGAPEDDMIQLECIGRDTEPVKNLIKTVRTWSLNRSKGTTTIRHPMPKDRARFAGAWAKSFPRPSRPMDTVILDTEQKDTIIRDMNEYLHPWSEHWYARRGIPYRRGYLFFGPPGTGKTSLSFALAGIFGLEIYVISLQEPTLTEGDLLQLFNGLPRRCIVLLEDVDAAGLKRDSKSNGRAKTKKETDSTGKAVTETKDADTYTLRDLARELKSLGGAGREKREGQTDAAQKRAVDSGISLSGLLNAIDGVATQEGRVLIMTTNHPEKLDPALVRPGRVDLRVEFGYAMKEQIRELFLRMYGASDGMMYTDRLQAELEPLKVSAEELEQLADAFAAQVPSNAFTPAEIQNLLMRHKREPRKSVAQAARWVQETLAEHQAQQEAEELGLGDDE